MELLEHLNFVPVYPVIGYALAGAALIGVPCTLKAMVCGGGTFVTKLATFHGLAVSLGLAALTLQKGNSLFAWHVIGMSFAIIGLQPAALQSILSKNSYTDVETRKARVMNHKLLQMAVAMAVGGGFAAIYLNKPAGFPGKHFMSVHSLVGLAAMGMMSWNFLDAAYRQGNPIKPKLLWVSWLHRSTGTVAFVLSLSAVMLGLFNRTAVVDWEARPITFSLPKGWNEMGGWAKSTHGSGLAWGFIMQTFLLLMMLLFHGPVKKVAETKKKS